MKIALFMCGETRSFNVDGKFQLLKLKEVIESTGHTLDCYGLHWDDCEYPDQDVVKFKQIKTMSQQVIRSWVEEDIENRAVINNVFCRNRWEELYDLDFNRIPTEELVYSSYTSVAQVFGGWFAMQMIPSEYDLYIRWRWDCSIDPGIGFSNSVLDERLSRNGTDEYDKEKHILTDYMLHMLVAKLEDVNNNIGHFDPNRGVGFLALPTSIVESSIRGTTIDDVFFIIRPSLKNKIDSVDVWEFFKTILRNYNFKNRPDGHNLWTDPFILDFGENVELSLPPMFGFTRRTGFQKFSERYQAYWDKYKRTYGKAVIGKASCDPW